MRTLPRPREKGNTKNTQSASFFAGAFKNFTAGHRHRESRSYDQLETAEKCLSHHKRPNASDHRRRASGAQSVPEGGRGVRCIGFVRPYRNHPAGSSRNVARNKVAPSVFRTNQSVAVTEATGRTAASARINSVAIPNTTG